MEERKRPRLYIFVKCYIHAPIAFKFLLAKHYQNKQTWRYWAIAFLSRSDNSQICNAVRKISEHLL